MAVHGSIPVLMVEVFQNISNVIVLDIGTSVWVLYRVVTQQFTSSLELELAQS